MPHVDLCDHGNTYGGYAVGKGAVEFIDHLSAAIGSDPELFKSTYTEKSPES